MCHKNFTNAMAAFLLLALNIEPVKINDLMVWRSAARPSRFQISIFRGSK
jgi:hypothetical protein